ncbi:hypothetical protein A3C32_00860 [Candidatus Daviesbacteria bacterium RIFCSPHIGHO2_02_FULL_41_14]|nr:MAG: hypothetical protein A3C32_00860 [Candidatus Daviesbacteria bacterium RIFCSPHIGHO2_02_FULL_41_14]
MTTLKQKILLLITVLGVALFYLFQQEQLLFLSSTPQSTGIAEQIPTDRPVVVSTVPAGINRDENITISPTQTIEVTFNMPLENIGEFKHKIEPTVEYKVELSNDRKTVQISPKSAWKLGTSYALTILPDSKFNENPGQESTKKKLDHDISIRFKSIEYRGI